MMHTQPAPDTTQPIWRGACPFCQRVRRIQSPAEMKRPPMQLPILTTEPLTLRQAIAQARISGTQLARMVDVDEGTISNILRGRSRGNVTNRQRIAAALGIPVGQIIWPEKVVG